MPDIDESEALAEPIETTLNADQVRPRQLVIDADAKQIILTVSKGYVDGGDFHEVFRDSITLKDEYDDEGNPVSEAYTNAMANTSLAEAVRDAPSAVGFGRIMREACAKIMKSVGMVS
jgi:hypothetical protein